MQTVHRPQQVIDGTGLRHVSLSDKYTATSGTVFISGIEALVRLMLDQRRLDRARGLNTAAFVLSLIHISTGWIGDLQSVRPDRPFFLYLAFGATHAPHQAPGEYLARWRGRFDDGYDEARDRLSLIHI